MPTIATDGKGNYVTLDDSGNWVPTSAPETQPQGGNRFTDAPPAEEKPTIDFATRQAGPPSSLDDLGLPLPQGGDSGAVGRIATAAVRGYQDSPPLLSPAVRQQEESTVAGKYGLSPINQLIGAGLGVLSGAGAAIGQGAYEVGSAIGGPQMGRDFYMGSQTPLEPGAGYLRMPAAEEGPKFVSERTAPPRPPGMTDAERIQQLVEHNVNEEQPVMGPPMARGPLTNTSTPGVAPDGSVVPPEPTPAAPASTPPPDPATSAGAKQIASAYYDTANRNGGTLTPQFANKFIDGVTAAAPQTEAGAAVAGQSAVSGLVDRLQSLRDKPMTLQAAQEVDEGLGNLIDKEYNNGRLSKDGKNLADIQQSFRDQILNAGPEDITGGTTGFDALGPARQAWSQAMKLSDLERIQTRAELSDNPATAIKSQVRTLLSNPAKVRGYSPDEVAALQEAANRGALGGALHVFGGRLVPVLAGLAGMSHGGPFGAIAEGAAAHVLTTGMRNWAERIQANRLGGAASVIGQGVPPPPLNRFMPPP